MQRLNKRLVAVWLILSAITAAYIGIDHSASHHGRAEATARVQVVDDLIGADRRASELSEEPKRRRLAGAQATGEADEGDRVLGCVAHARCTLRIPPERPRPPPTCWWTTAANSSDERRT